MQGGTAAAASVRVSKGGRPCACSPVKALMPQGTFVGLQMGEKAETDLNLHTQRQSQVSVRG